MGGMLVWVRASVRCMDGMLVWKVYVTYFRGWYGWRVNVFSVNIVGDVLVWMACYYYCYCIIEIVF